MKADRNTKNASCIKYMHLVEGHAGHFDGWQVVYASRQPVPLAEDLNQIRREQRKTVKNRLVAGMKADMSDYGYIRVLT